MSQYSPPDYNISYGPDANCTLAICDVGRSVYGYRPSVPANATFLALFAINAILHAIQGWRYPRRYLSFAIPMIIGGIDEIIGYSGRLMLYKNPFSFEGFLIQIICIAVGPAFYSASIYVTISQVVLYLGRQHSRFRPSLFYWTFIPCDVVSLSLQAAGGALSSASTGASKAGVNISLAGLSFQVATLLCFVGLCIDYAMRWRKATKSLEESQLATKRNFKIFVAFLSLAIVLIVARCIYRIDELSDGYTGPLIGDQGLFIGLEGVLIIIAAFCLNIAHPGFGLQSSADTQGTLMRNDNHLDMSKTSAAVMTKA